MGCLSIDGQISIISSKKSVESIANKYGIEDIKQQTSQKANKRPTGMSR